MNTVMIMCNAFGSRQIVGAATPYRKIFGIESSNGRVFWSRVLETFQVTRSWAINLPSSFSGCKHPPLHIAGLCLRPKPILHADRGSGHI
ncbi:hypothetical protein BDR07DRAFT_1425791 [Suillus spraguei]|nr:hypothetical protein BDR07DRAFT_1425791 [Suillus spraguei]